jgi:cell wall-associated NlpC family hydrolase
MLPSTVPRRPEPQAKLGKRAGIYIGDGRFIHAPLRGQTIRAESADHPDWAARFSGTEARSTRVVGMKR